MKDTFLLLKDILPSVYHARYSFHHYYLLTLVEEARNGWSSETTMCLSSTSVSDKVMESQSKNLLVCHLTITTPQLLTMEREERHRDLTSSQHPKEKFESYVSVLLPPPSSSLPLLPCDPRYSPQLPLPPEERRERGEKSSSPLSSSTCPLADERERKGEIYHHFHLASFPVYEEGVEKGRYITLFITPHLPPKVEEGEQPAAPYHSQRTSPTGGAPHLPTRKPRLTLPPTPTARPPPPTPTPTSHPEVWEDIFLVVGFSLPLPIPCGSHPPLL